MANLAVRIPVVCSEGKTTWVEMKLDERDSLRAFWPSNGDGSAAKLPSTTVLVPPLPTAGVPTARPRKNVTRHGCSPYSLTFESVIKNNAIRTVSDHGRVGGLANGYYAYSYTKSYRFHRYR